MREWQAAEDGLDVLIVDWNSPVYGGESMVGTYYVAVVAYEPRGDVYFRLVLIVEDEDGVSTVVTAGAGRAADALAPSKAAWR